MLKKDKIEIVLSGIAGTLFISTAAFSQIFLASLPADLTFFPELQNFLSSAITLLGQLW